jgi:glycerophosphoryl diester phosphodiesterase
MIKMIYLFASTVLLAVGCSPAHKAQQLVKDPLDLQAHRGGRGLMPENTIGAMKNAIDLGATTLEMDVLITKDNQVVVSHDPFFNEVITTTPEGKYIEKKDAQNYLLYSMTYDSIRKYDVGLKPHPDFPRQKKVKAYKPLLTELIDSVETYAASKGKKMRYNIEIKSNSRFDGVRHPEPKVFTDMLLQVLKNKKILDRVTIQSFDTRPLQYLHQAYPTVTLSYLVEKNSGTFQEQMDKLGFTPQVYSPLYTMLDKDIVDACHSKGMKVIPWTVNTVAEIQSLVKLGVDGLISDYPDLFSQVHK